MIKSARRVWTRNAFTCGLLATALAGCAREELPPVSGEQARTPAEAGGLLLEINSPGTKYLIGDPVPVTVIVTNTGEERLIFLPVRLNLFVEGKGARQACYAGSPLPPWKNARSLSPGERVEFRFKRLTKEFAYSWFLGPGAYRVNARYSVPAAWSGIGTFPKEFQALEGRFWTGKIEAKTRVTVRPTPYSVGSNGLRIDIRVPKTRYEIPERVDATVYLTNTGEKPLVLFGPSCRLRVEGAGADYIYKTKPPFAPGCDPRTLAAGETVIFRFSGLQDSHGGWQLLPGKCRLTALYALSEKHFRQFPARWKNAWLGEIETKPVPLEIK